MARRTSWLVSVQKPRKSDGGFWILRAKPPKGACDSAGAPLRELRRSTKTFDRSVAQQQAEELARKLNAQLPLKNDPLFSEVFEQHVAFRENDGQTAASTAKRLGEARPYVLPALEGVRASTLSRAAVTRARDYLAQQPNLAASTANLYLRCAARAWNWAYEREVVQVPWPRIKKLKEAPVEKRPYTPEELQAVLDWLRAYQDGVWLPFFAVLADSSCRIGAVCSVRGGDLNREANEIFIRRAKGGKSKTVAVSPETMALIPVGDPDRWAFPAIKDPTKPLNRRTAGHVLRRAVKAVGIPDGHRLDIHSFRRAWVSHATRADVPDTVGARQTGHADLRIYHSYQRNTVGDDLHEAVRKVSAYRASARARSKGATEEEIPSSPTPPQVGQNGEIQCLPRHDLPACLSSATTTWWSKIPAAGSCAGSAWGAPIGPAGRRAGGAAPAGRSTNWPSAPPSPRLAPSWWRPECSSRCCLG